MSGFEFPLKKSNVSYSCNETTKSLVVPLLDVKYDFGTKLTDPVWKKAVWARDFVPFKKERLDRKSEMALFRTGKHLVIGLFFYENVENIVRPANMYSDPWTGDFAEIHLGDMEPDPWLIQLGVGCTGIRFDSTGNYDKWQAKHFVTENGWGAEVRMDLSFIRLTEGGFRFNVCRQSLEPREFSTWSPLQWRFHEIENCGELLFVDYKTALQIKSGKTVSGRVSRKVYETARSRDMIHAQKVVHGPFISSPDRDSVKISWGTAGLVPSYIEYREKGSHAVPRRQSSGYAHGILYHNNFHYVHLTGLEPGKEYEYEIFTMKPVLLTPESSGVKHTFIMPGKDKDRFSFFCITDIHSDAGYVRKALSIPEAGKADFIALLGDHLSHAAGADALYDGVVDPVADKITVNGKDKPLVFVRGNHEQLGVYAKEFFNIMGDVSGKSYYSFNWGKVCFIVLDSGGDSFKYDDSILYNNQRVRKEQKEFLQKLVRSEAYLNAEFRIIMMHIPPAEKNTGSICDGHYEMMEPLRNAAVTPDVAVCGHIHAYERINAGEDHYAPETDSAHADKYPETFSNPFPVIALVNSAGLSCEIADGRMTLSVIEVMRHEKAVLIDKIELKKK